MSEKKPWRIFFFVSTRTERVKRKNCYIHFIFVAAVIWLCHWYLYTDADVLSHYLFYKWIMLVRFQRVRAALVAAQMFCVEYINTEESLFENEIPTIWQWDETIARPDGFNCVLYLDLQTTTSVQSVLLQVFMLWLLCDTAQKQRQHSSSWLPPRAPVWGTD